MISLGIILIMAVSITFIFAGSLKLVKIKESSDFAKNLGIFPEKLGAVLGFLMPLLEVSIGITMVLSDNKFIKIMALGIIMFFIFLNLKAILEKKEYRCFCYGRLIESKLGISGLVHYLYIAICLIFSFIFVEGYIIKLLSSYSNVETILMIIFAFLISCNSIIIQVVLDKVE